MGGYHLNFTPPHFLLIFFLVVLSSSVRTLGDDACTKAFCGEGTCVLSSNSYGYDCVCNRGWQKVELTFISCALPNCTLDFTCGSRVPPPPPPPASLLPPLNFSSPCNFVLCGEGTCVVNGTEHYCQCNTGSANLLNLSALPCLNRCSLGLDCNDGLLGAPPPPPNGTLASPRSPPNGLEKISKRWSSCMVLLSTIILAWIVYE